jgi:hypothetical protein
MLGKAGCRRSRQFVFLPRGCWRLDQPAIIPAREIALLVAGLQHLTVLNDDTDSSGEVYGAKKLGNAVFEKFRVLHFATKLRKRGFSARVLHTSAPSGDSWEQQVHHVAEQKRKSNKKLLQVTKVFFFNCLKKY